MTPTPDRSQQIEALFHAARERGRGVLADVDPDLRREVESLLSEATTLHHAPGDPQAESPELPTVLFEPGARLGPYRIERLIGQGGMGKVYCASDTRLGRSVAIKTANARFSERFEREARSIAALNHPHICHLYDVGPDYLVMEYIEGTPLKGPLPLDDALRYAEQIASALEAAHQRGIVHRDLKPANILLSNHGIKLLDFGVAQMKPGPDDPTATLTGALIGTPAYMAPEQFQGKHADARSDIYSFGCVLYEMIAGKRVGRLAAASGAVAAASPELDRILGKCLEDEPDLRYQNASEIRADLFSLRRETESARMVAAVAPIAPAGIARHWKLILPLASAVMAAGLAGYFYSHRAPKLTDKDVMVLADFVNTTGDPVFDGALRQGLAFQLEQSPFLKIMDDDQVQQDLRLMSLPPGTRITSQVAHDICARDGAAATINGSIASLGKSYAITLHAATCQGGVTLAREQIQAGDKEHVLNAVGTAATALRGKLGESRGSIEKLNRPLEQATTSSLEALKTYTEGKVILTQGGFLAARPLFERAIVLDPNFAMAYYYEAIASNNAGDNERETEYYKKAFALIDRVSEFERDIIAAGYYESTRDLDKGGDSYRLGIANYPRDWSLHNNLSVNYIDLGQFEDGLREGLTAAQLQPNAEPPYRRLMDAYMCLDRLDEAKKVEETLRTRGMGGARIHQRFLEIGYIGGDQAAISREIQWFAGKPEEYLSLGLQAANLNVLGQRRESAKLYKRAAETALHHGLGNVAAGFDEADARADVLTGNCGTARRLGRPALALAMCGETAQAEKLAAETSKRFPNGTLWNAVQLPEIRAAIEIQRDQPAKAVELLASAPPYERGYPEVAYLRGLAYLRLRKGVEAAAEFRKIVDHKGASWGSTWLYPNWGLQYSISYVGLARAAALTGDTAGAKKAFEDFFALWKDSDQDLPFLLEAKKDYAALR